MKTTETRSLMSSLRNRKGFSLVEMAIVLVIIGIIIGAVMKGNDIITNSRAKQVTTAVNTWKALAYAYMDRNGRLPGDSARDGVIGLAFGPYSSALTLEKTQAQSSINEIKTTMQNAPTNPVTIGSLTFWTYFGNVPGATGTRNIMILCKDKDCANAFTTDELEIVKAVDTAIDGNADAAKGVFRANSLATTPATPSTDWVVETIANFANNSSASSTGSTSKGWDLANGYTSAVWAFDRPW